MATATLSRENGADRRETPSGSIDRLIVTWQHPQTRAVSPIGILTYDGHSYEFAYLRRAKAVDGFRPLLGFPRFEERYESEALFTLFAQRAMDPRRPDFHRYVQGLGLSDDATPWEQLTRSGGDKESDTLQLFPVPRYEDQESRWACYLLVHGVRYLMEKDVIVGDVLHEKYSLEEFESVLARLQSGDELRVVHESTNTSSDHSLLATTTAHSPLGWLPDWLAEEVIQLQHDGELTFSVDTVNPPDSGWHMRLVVRLEASCAKDYEFFAGDYWSTYS